MPEKVEFEDGFTEKIPRDVKRRAIRSSVIEKDTIVIGSRRQVVGERGQPGDSGKASVEVVEENGEVVGIIYKCACGHHQKIRFEFDD